MQTLYSVCFPVFSNKDKVVAIVTAEVDSRTLTNEHEFLSAIRSATTKWVENTESGGKFCKEKGRNANIGDLSNVCNGGITAYLEGEGITNLIISVYYSPNYPFEWYFDSPLID